MGLDGDRTGGLAKSVLFTEGSMVSPEQQGGTRW